MKTLIINSQIVILIPAFKVFFGKLTIMTLIQASFSLSLNVFRLLRMYPNKKIFLVFCRSCLFVHIYILLLIPILRFTNLITKKADISDRNYNTLFVCQS